MASIRRRDPKDAKSPWVVEYTDPKTGKRHRETPKSGLKRDAEKLRVKIETEIAGGIHVASSQTATVGEVLDDWLKRCEQRVKAKDNLRKVTYEKNRGRAERHIRPRLGHIRLSQLHPRDVQKWVDDLAFAEANSLGRQSLQQMVSILRRVIRHGQTTGLVTRNVLIDHPVTVPGRLPGRIAIPSKAKLKRILEFSKLNGRGRPAPYLRPMVHLAAYCGLRLGEIRGLKWEHVDLENHVLRVRHGMDIWGNLDDPKSRAGVRDVPMPPVMVQEMRLWAMQCGRPSAGLVFLGQTKSWVHESAVEVGWRRLLNRALKGCDDGPIPAKQGFHFHALRHFYASLLIEAGLPPKRVQYLMGHSSITITFDRYGHLFDDPEMVTAALEKFGALMEV